MIKALNLINKVYYLKTISTWRTIDLENLNDMGVTVVKTS